MHRPVQLRGSYPLHVLIEHSRDKIEYLQHTRPVRADTEMIGAKSRNFIVSLMSLT